MSDILVSQFHGKVIRRVSVESNTLMIEFTDGTELYARDRGQSCCEHRYMNTDDDLKYFEDTVFYGIDERSVPDVEDDYGDVVECVFMHVNTSAGTITVANYNEHNGYYGGFWLVYSER